VYSWIWRHLPGPVGVRAATALLLLLVCPALDGPGGLWEPTL
jgi:hypothetical protein